jgi:protein-arginine kinase
MYRAITQIQQSCTSIYCIKCTLSYPKKWYDTKLNRCFFCATFHSVYHTRNDILKELEWQFIKSGESDRKEYYQTYLKQMDDWCIHYSIESHKIDQEMEKDIRYTWNIDK